MAAGFRLAHRSNGTGLCAWTVTFSRASPHTCLYNTLFLPILLLKYNKCKYYKNEMFMYPRPITYLQVNWCKTAMFKMHQCLDSLILRWPLWHTNHWDLILFCFTWNSFLRRDSNHVRTHCCQTRDPQPGVWTTQPQNIWNDSMYGFEENIWQIFLDLNKVSPLWL